MQHDKAEKHLHPSEGTASTLPNSDQETTGGISTLPTSVRSTNAAGRRKRMSQIAPTTAVAVDQYIAHRSHCAPNTLTNDRSVLRRFAAATGNPRIDRLTQSDVENFFINEVGGQAPSSFNKVRSRVAGFLAFCRRRSWVMADLLTEVRPRRVRQVERQRLNAGQLVALATALPDPRDRAYVALALNTGLWANEITSIRVSDVDLDGGTIHVQIHKSYIEDSMPITLELDRALRCWLIAYAEELGQALALDAYLVPARRQPTWSRDGVMSLGQLRTHHRISKPHGIIQRAMRAIGVEKTRGEGVHTIRRSVARLFFDQAVDQGEDGALRVTASLLHHKNVATTEAYIGVTRDRSKRDAMMRGQSLFSALEATNVLPIRRQA